MLLLKSRVPISTWFPSCAVPRSTSSLGISAITSTSDFVQALTVTVPLGLWIVTIGRASTLKCRSSRRAEAEDAANARAGTKRRAVFQFVSGTANQVSIGLLSLFVHLREQISLLLIGVVKEVASHFALGVFAHAFFTQRNIVVNDGEVLME